jgi:hypothetical protein
MDDGVMAELPRVPSLPAAATTITLRCAPASIHWMIAAY